MLTEHLFYGLLPMVLIAGIASNCTAVMNTFERFALPALAPIATPLAISLGAWLLAAKLGIWVLVYANVAGAGPPRVRRGRRRRLHRAGAGRRL